VGRVNLRLFGGLKKKEKKEKKKVSIILKSRSQEYRRHVLFIWCSCWGSWMLSFQVFLCEEAAHGYPVGLVMSAHACFAHRYPFCSSHVITFIIFIQRINGYLILDGCSVWVKIPYASSFSFYFEDYIYFFFYLLKKNIYIYFCEFNNLVNILGHQLHVGVIN
jgi:hypothetical protein